MFERVQEWWKTNGPSWPSVIAAIALVGFIAGAAYWFIHNARSGASHVSAGQVFIGLGYMSGVLLVSLIAVLGWRMLSSVGNGGPQWRLRRPRDTDDHSIIRAQLGWGSSLVVVGAILGAICLCFVHAGDNGPVLALATAVISAGAVLLPAGAASSASGRIQQAAKGAAPVVSVPTVTRDTETAATLTGIVVPNGADGVAYFEFQGMPADGSAPTAAIAQVQPTTPITGSSPAQTVTAQLATLEAGQAYQVRLAAKTSSGTVVASEWAPLDATPATI